VRTNLQDARIGFLHQIIGIVTTAKMRRLGPVSGCVRQHLGHEPAIDVTQPAQPMLQTARSALRTAFLQQRDIHAKTGRSFRNLRL
jgi:membrane-bound metal-dependent hydrolase YbcI (DUF457 family)